MSWQYISHATEMVQLSGGNKHFCSRECHMMDISHVIKSGGGKVPYVLISLAS